MCVDAWTSWTSCSLSLSLHNSPKLFPLSFPPLQNLAHSPSLCVDAWNCAISLSPSVKLLYNPLCIDVWTCWTSCSPSPRTRGWRWRRLWHTPTSRIITTLRWTISWKYHNLYGEKKPESLNVYLKIPLKDLH